MTPTMVKSLTCWAVLLILLNPSSAELVPSCASVFGCLSFSVDTSCPNPDEFWSPTAVLGGCCPGCVKGLPLGTPCGDAFVTEGPETSVTPCAPGLVCGDGSVCQLNTTCSRRRAELEAEGRFDVTLHCTQSGNYEKLQCDRGVCWCADPQTGSQTPGTRAVPEDLWNLLPCYNETLHGAQYLRRCESVAFSQTLQRKQFIIRGHTGVTFTNALCGYDGSHGWYSIEGQECVLTQRVEIAACTWHDGTKIDPYRTSLQTLPAMNCNCARDEKLFAMYGRRMELACEGNGNYVPLQSRNGALFCVDPDGFVVAQNVPEKTNCAQFIFGASVI
uniref:Thyroglobulin type-1 domain-containing protein n=1 Tax=Anopheles farauti TaxID=69004 RepID=A0A182Q7H4_9DIPT